MVNFSDGKTDGLIMVYQKQGKIYAVAFDRDELKVLDSLISVAISKMSIIDKPLDIEVIE